MSIISRSFILFTRGLSARAQSTGVQRGEYAHLTDNDVGVFKNMLGTNKVKQSDIEPYLTDWLNTITGTSKLVLTPSTVEEVSAVLAYCHERRLAIVPQGVVECESGVVLQNLFDYVMPHGFTVPLDLGARGSCQIGGNLATHAGGLRVIRYGQLRASVLGLRTVLPAGGKILDSLSRMRKDNTGYDLKQLFIGSEGTLGVITDVTLLLPQASLATNTALFACASYPDVISCYRTARKHLGEIVSACEFLDNTCMEAVNEKLGLASPFDTSYPFYFLVETSGSDRDHDMVKLERCMDHMFEQSQCLDGVLGSSSDQCAHLMSLRENVSVAMKSYGYNFKYDVSLPTADMYSLVHKIKDRLQEIDNITVGYGHLGDNNIHLNVAIPDFRQEVLELLEPFVFKEVLKLRGSISSEHGIGHKKANFLHYSKSETMIEAMKMMKDVFDPHHILNPYKVLPWC